jgi:hypothetical protein
MAYMSLEADGETIANALQKDTDLAVQVLVSFFFDVNEHHLFDRLAKQMGDCGGAGMLRDVVLNLRSMADAIEAEEAPE